MKGKIAKVLAGALLVLAVTAGVSAADKPPNGPTSCPKGAVNVYGSTSADIQAAVNLYPAGNKAFCLRSTSYAFSAPVVPKSGDQFHGVPALPAIKVTLDGGSTTQFAFEGNQNGIEAVTIRDMIVQHFNPPPQLAALDHSPGPNTPTPGRGWTIKNNEVLLNSTEGIEIGNNSLIDGNHVHDNGQLGMFSYQSHDAIVSNNEVDHNNTACFDQTVEAGGIKVAGTVNIQIKTNNVHDNQGTGIWLDTADTGFLIDSNTVLRSSHHGIKVESGSTGNGPGTVSHNTVNTSGFAQGSCGVVVGGSNGINIDGSGTGHVNLLISVTNVNNVACSLSGNYAYVNNSNVFDDGTNLSGSC